MNKIKEILKNKREATDSHIKELELKGKQGIRYTSMMPNFLFLILGLVSDVGWLIHLIAGIIYFCKNGFHHVLDFISLIPLIAIIFGIIYISYLNKKHEKEIATKKQKDLSFGIIAFAGLTSAIIGILQIVILIGGFLNFATTLPIYLSFKKGIIYEIE